MEHSDEKMSNRDSISNWPYNVWNILIASLSANLSENGSVAESNQEKCSTILEQLPKNCTWLVPVKNPHSVEYGVFKDDCKSFNVWLFGQLFSVFHRDSLETNHRRCLDTQIELLQYLWENDPSMYRVLLRFYVNIFQEMCLASSCGIDFQPTTYDWFSFTPINEKLYLPKPTFKVNSLIQLHELINFILSLLTSQMANMFTVCPSIPSRIWECSLSLLKTCPNKSQVYQLISHLLTHDLALAERKYNTNVADLLLRVLDDISSLCQLGKLSYEDEFSNLLNILGDISCLPLCQESTYVRNVYYLLLQIRQPLDERVEETLFVFFDKLLRESDVDEADLNVEVNLANVNLALLRSLSQHFIENGVRRKKPARFDCQTNKFWRFLIEQILTEVQSANPNNAKQVLRLFKLVHSVTKSAASITYQFDTNFVFFGEKIVDILKELTKLCEIRADKQLLYLLLNVVKDVLTLNESSALDEKHQKWLLQLLYLRWVSRTPTDSLYHKFVPVMDENLVEFCVVAAMSTRRYQFEQWKTSLFSQIFENSSAQIIKSTPLFVSSLNNTDVAEFVDHLLKSNIETLTELSFYIRSLICALTGCCTLAKLPKRDIDLYCSVCDKDTPPTAPADSSRRDLATAVVVRMMESSEEARYNIISATVRLFNHIPKSDRFLSQLRDCFLSENRKIREKIIEATPSIIFKDLDAESYAYEEAVFQSFRKCLRAVTLFALVNEDASLQYVCLAAITKLGCVPLEITLLPSITMLLPLRMSAVSLFMPLAKASLLQVAIAHNVQMEDHIYLKYAEYVFPLVARILVDNFLIFGVGVANLPDDHTSLLNNLTINHALQYLLPHIAENANLQPIVNDLAALCGTPVAQLLRNAFKQVFPHVMLFEKPATVTKVMGIVCAETNNTMSELLSCCVTKVLAELFIYYEEYEEKVKWVLAEIKKLAMSSSKAEAPRTVTELNIESFLQSRFFGVLMKLENQLCNDMVSEASRRRVLSSFKSIIKFMSSAYISSVRFKVLFTLRTITVAEKDKMPTLCIQIWDVFVRRIEIALLGPILSNIFVSLLPFMTSHTHSVNSIFRYLVVENGGAVANHFIELYFVPVAQCDADIVAVVEAADCDLRAMSLQDRLEWLLEATKHEVAEIKLHALCRIRQELATNRKDISQLILASDSVNSLIFRVLDILVEGFRNLDPHLQEASGVCLGEFGAIDPSYIPNTVIKVDDAKKYHCYQIDDVEFVVTTFTLLCRGFQMAKSSSNMDTFALAIQSLLASYEVKQDEKCKYWSQIPKNLREIILPFYSTTYTLLKNVNEAAYDIPHLVYGSNKAQTVQKWAYNWSNFLISLLPADSKAKEVFTYCKGPMSCEIKCMLFFLPHILLNALLASDNSNLSKIYEEMIAVIRYDQNGGLREDYAQKTSTQLVATEELSIISNMDLEMGVICTKTMFNLLDVLHKKHRDMKFDLKGRPNVSCKKLDQFLNKFCKYQLAEKAFERKEYVRSLLYLEEYLASDGVDLDRYLVLLAKIYVHLNDVDSVKGLFATHSMKLRQLQNVIMLHEITDQFQDAAICYQQLLKTAMDDERALVYEKRMIQCYLAMNQPETALRFVNSLSKTTESKNRKFFDDVECEALWNLSQFDKLKKLTSSKSALDDDTWGVRIGQSIVHFLNGDQEGLAGELRRIRNTLTKALHMSTAAFGGYRESYEHAVKLHILNEFEKIAELVFSVERNQVADADWQQKFGSVVQVEFEERLNKLQPTSRALRPVLNIRQTLFSVASRLLATKRPELVPLFEEEKHKCWLKVLEIANRARNFQLAYSNIVAIDQYQLKGFFIEKAKYYWEKMEQQEALRTLQHGLQFHFSDIEAVAKQPKAPTEEQKICAEAYMLLGTYNDEVANTDSATNLGYFKRACFVCKHSEKTYMKFAHYHDKFLRAQMSPPELYRQSLDDHYNVVKLFGQSLVFGCEFIYQSLSRMLNVWLDFANCLVEDGGRVEAENRRAAEEKRLYRPNASVAQLNAGLPNRAKELRKMTALVNEFLTKLPAYYFLTAFSLIMSRFMHPSIECFDVLEKIVVQCALNFPHQTLWQFTSLYRPDDKEGPKRVAYARARRVLNNSNLSALQPTIRKYTELFQEFSKLCRASKTSNLNHGQHPITAVVRRNSALLTDGAFDGILIPAQKFLTIVLPRQVGDKRVDPAYNPFPERMVFLARLERQATVYSSMQKPVRTGLVGTDGVVYPMIFKSMDDMRIDSRAMEFNSVVNMYLKRDVEGRDRALRIRTYTVLPLTDNCGIIEFISRLETMRSVIASMRRSIGLNDGKLKEYKYQHEDTEAKKRECFKQLLLMYPPLLHNWYKLEFPNPSSWYVARTSYVRTLAVMSIVGYMLGLGDRHNDNILLDCTNGDVIHVDFNALFNKGETLPVPERVPFRLTHSMVKAMGPLGYEGGFLHTCELVNRILRSRKDQLLSVLNTFLYDPLDFFADHGTRRRSGTMSQAAELNLKNVDDRLKGVVRSFAKGNSIPLSVEGQTRKLIEEATDPTNLINMFMGWGAYI